ncbi:hypothetical protein F4819DRAFT_99406 [Hypoxylon fuscum]|nr:hypothetical protein F4819DRAFT_99406 [Hypoxylon fuscum]
MSASFFGEADTQDSSKRLPDVLRRSRAASDSPPIEEVNSSRHLRPPTPPPRRSSWGFSRHFSDRKHTSPPKSYKPPLRRKLKWPSLRSRADPTPTQDPQVFVAKNPKRVIMSSPAGPTTTTGGGGTSLTGPDRNREQTTAKHSLPMPGLSGNANGPVGNLLKGPVDDSGKLKDAALLVGIKLDLEAEIHATARVRGDIVVGLY